MKRAFTLIELLVVIAIIAILAAILFPVFAQAKLQAKKVASLSNVKETGLAELMYQNDSDDNFVLFQNTCDPNASGGTPALCISSGPNQNTAVGVGSADTWVYLIQPYMKNFGIMVDPGVGDVSGYIVGSQSTRVNQDYWVDYGYNYLFLSPFWQCNSALSRNESLAAHPAGTVMFTTSQAFTTSPMLGFFGSNAPGAWPITSPAPNACIYYDGTTGSGNWSANNPATIGKITSSTRAVKPYGGANVVWVDGHAKFGSDGYLATGTDYSTATYNGSGQGAHIINLNTYLWSLDGTTNDLGL